MKTVKRNVSFHNFLLEKKDLLQKWLHALTIPEFVPTKSLLVCSEHFESRCFEKLLTIVGRLPCDAAHIDMVEHLNLSLLLLYCYHQHIRHCCRNPLAAYSNFLYLL